MSWETTDVLSAAAADALSAATTDVLPADTTNVLSADTTGLSSANGTLEGNRKMLGLRTLDLLVTISESLDLPKVDLLSNDVGRF